MVEMLAKADLLVQSPVEKRLEGRAILKEGPERLPKLPRLDDEV
jgi:hypothetical protein